MLFDCPCFAAGRLRSDPEATIRAIAWVTMTGRVRRGDPCNMAVHSAVNCGQALPLCVRPDRTPESIWLHTFAATQICNNAFRPNRRSVKTNKCERAWISKHLLSRRHFCLCCMTGAAFAATGGCAPSCLHSHCAFTAQKERQVECSSPSMDQ